MEVRITEPSFPQRCSKCKGEAKVVMQNAATRMMRVNCPTCGERTLSYVTFANELGLNLSSRAIYPTL